VTGVYFLSRPSEPGAALDIPASLSEGELARATAVDLTLRIVAGWVANGWPQRCPSRALQPYFRRRASIASLRGCLLYGDRVILPDFLLPVVRQLIHDLHVGIERCKALCRLYFWFPTLDQVIADTVNSCPACQLTRSSPPPDKSASWPPAAAPWDRLHLDFGEIDGRTFCIIVDAGTGWVECDWVSRPKTSEAIRLLRRAFRTHDLCYSIVTDNGPGFASAEFVRFCPDRGIQHLFAPPYNPRSNGVAEVGAGG